jgi:hypothetical protein
VREKTGFILFAQCVCVSFCPHHACVLYFVRTVCVCFILSAQCVCASFCPHSACVLHFVRTVPVCFILSAQCLCALFCLHSACVLYKILVTKSNYFAIQQSLINLCNGSRFCLLGLIILVVFSVPPHSPRMLMLEYYHKIIHSSGTLFSGKFSLLAYFSYSVHCDLLLCFPLEFQLSTFFLLSVRHYRRTKSPIDLSIHPIP